MFTRSIFSARYIWWVEIVRWATHVGIDELHMKSFFETYNLTNLIKQPTCYKNLDNPTCIDLILTNIPRTFQSTCVIETGLSDFHLMTLTIMRKTFKKQRPRIINYRSFKHSSNEELKKYFKGNLSNQTSIMTMGSIGFVK